MNIKNSVNFNSYPVINLKLERPFSLPSGLGAQDEGRMEYYQGKIYVWNGSAWNSWPAAGGGGSAGLEVPSSTFFVSPGYVSLQKPYFATIQDAIDEAARAGDIKLVVVFPGEYDEKLSVASDIDLYFYECVKLKPKAQNSTPLISVTGAVSSFNIDGDLVIQNDDGANNPYGLSLSSTMNCSVKLRAITGASTSGINILGNYSNINISVESVNGKTEISSQSSININTFSLGAIRIINQPATVKIHCQTFEGLFMTQGMCKIHFIEATGVYSPGNYLVELNAGAGQCEAWLYEGRIVANAAAGNGNMRIGSSSTTKLWLQHVHMENTGGGYCLDITGGKVITNMCTLVSSGTYTVNKSSGTWKNYKSVANKTFTAGSTPLVDTLTVNTNVE